MTFLIQLFAVSFCLHFFNTDNSLNSAGISDAGNKELSQKTPECFIAENQTISTAVVEPEISDSQLRQMIGEMIMVGFRGTELDDDHHLIRDFNDYHLGGVIIYEYDVPGKTRPRNIESHTQLRRLTNQIRTLAGKPVFIAVDEEGGRVSRLRPAYGYPALPSAMHYGNLNNIDSTKAWATALADKCRAAGINMNFAPVVDLCLNPDGPVIAAIERCFSDQPEIVAQHAAAVVEEHRKLRVVTALKHFPGHGSAGSDTHYDFTDVSDVWSSIELLPYLLLLQDNSIDMIMTAHVFNERWDTLYPASLSHHVLTGMLREQLQFDGIIITDDLQMAAVSEQFGRKETILQAILAGADILLFSNNSPAPYNPDVVPETVETILELIDAGKISRQRIEESYRRIGALKQRL